MLSDTLVTNEIKNASGTEVEFSRWVSSGRSTEFRNPAAAPSLPQILSISHTETGTGLRKTRRSVIRFDVSHISTVDNVTPLGTECHLVLTNPIGGITTNAQAQLVLAYMMSFLASLGASTTILYDGTGNGAKTLLEGSL